MPQGLRKAAEQNHRSLNGEILARLERLFRPPTVDVDTLLAQVRTIGEHFHWHRTVADWFR